MRSNTPESKSAISASGRRWYARLLFHSSRSIAWLAIIVVLALSLLAVAGWMLNVPLLKSVESQWISMKVVTAVCLVFAAIALALIHKGPTRRLQIIPTALGALVSLVGALTVGFYAFALSAGREPAFAAAPLLSLILTPAARMALATGGMFFLVGCALILLATGNRRAADIAHGLALPVAAVGYLVPVSYLLGVAAIHLHTSLGVPVALNTGFAFLALVIAIYCVRPDTWLMRGFIGDHAGSVMARRLLPGLLMLPIVIGWLRIRGERTGAFESEAGVVLVAVTYAVCFLLLVWVAAQSVNRTDERRRASSRALAESETKYRIVADNTYDFEFWLDPQGKYLYASPSCERVTGYRPEEFLVDSELQFKIAHPEDRQVLRDHTDEVERGKQAGALDFRIAHRDGTTRWIGHVCQPVFDADGKFLGTRGSNRDITERKRAEEEIARQLEELQRWQAVMLDREDRNMELKREVNALLGRLDEPARYASQVDAEKGNREGRG
jgi:PAS domain S-box-containing protein